MSNTKQNHVLAIVGLHQELDNEALCDIVTSNPRIIAMAKQAPVNNCPGPYTASLLSRIGLRSFFMIVLIKDHNSMCKVPMDGNGFVLAEFLKRYIPEDFLIDDEVQPETSCWNDSHGGAQ